MPSSRPARPGAPATASGRSSNLLHRRLPALLVIATVPMTALAEGPEQRVLEEVKVTGTLLRGVAPVGNNLIEMDKKQIQATGATTATQLLQSIPQNASFNDLQISTAASNFVTINRPNLRDMPETGGASPTLVLFDGHRVVGMGVRSTSPDVDIVPPSLIQRVEVVPDGGSAIYGSDAVAGVINFITRRDFEGVELDVRYGTADNYNTVDANLTGGFTWDGGSAYVAYNYAERDAIYGEDRDWVRMFPNNRPDIPALGQPVIALECEPGNVRVAGQSYALPFTTGNAVPGTVNQCDRSDGVSVYPAQERDSLMVGFTQDLGAKANLSTRAYYMERDTQGTLDRLAGTVTITPGGSPFYDDHKATDDPREIQAVDVQFGNTRVQDINLETWGIYPTLTIELPHNWQLRALASYGESETENHDPSASTAALTAAVAGGLFNPYDVAASDPRAVAAIGNWETYGNTQQSLLDFSAIADGDLFSLPGGEVKLAVGAEYQDQEYDVQQGDVVIGTQDTGFAGLMIDGVELYPASDRLETVKLDRDVTSAFAEIVVPVFGDGNAVAGLRELTLSASVRYDDYSDFGDTSNPKFGLNWRPVDWVLVRASWGESFVAPSLADNSATTQDSANFAAIPFLFPPQELIDNGTFPAVQPGQQAIVLLGTAPDIAPQTAETTSIGLDIQPPAVPGLDLSLTWWEIKYADLIDLPGFVTQLPSWTTFVSYKTVSPSQEQIDSTLGEVDTVVGTCNPQPDCVYTITDARITNTGDFQTDGLDLGVFYATDTDFGTVDFSVNANYVLNREQSVAPGAPFINELDTDYSRFRARTVLGANVGNLRAEAQWYHRAGYNIGSPVGVPPQGDVDAFDVVNLFFNYEVQGEGLLSDLSLSLSVNNVFDEDPPEYRVTNTLVLTDNGYINGRTIGRLFQFGIQKRFN